MSDFGKMPDRIPILTSSGSSIPVFVGYRRQVGGGIFGDFIRSAVPYAKRAFSAVAPTLRKVGKKALKRTIKAGAAAVGDVLSGEKKTLGEAISARAREAALKTLGRAPYQSVAEEAGPSASAIDKPEDLEEAKKTVEEEGARELGVAQKGSGRQRQRRRRTKTRSRSRASINKRHVGRGRKTAKKRKAASKHDIFNSPGKRSRRH